ncbi:MAG: alpha/beta fold hydrolase [Anaerolineales bacterium]
MLANDLQALAAAAQERPALDDVLPIMAMPCFLLIGEADSRYPEVQKCAKYIGHATLVSLPGLNHTMGFTRSDLVLPHVMKFLATIRV